MISNTTFDIVVNGIVLKPLRLKKKEVCDYLKFSVEQLRKVSMNDESFPRPIKTGSTRQSGVIMILTRSCVGKRKICN